MPDNPLIKPVPESGLPPPAALGPGTPRPSSPHIDSTELQKVRSEYQDGLSRLLEEPIETRNPEDEMLAASYVRLLGALFDARNVELYQVALLGLQALRSGRQSLARQIARELSYQTSTSAALGQVMRGLIWFLIGLAVLVFVATYTFMVAGLLKADLTGIMTILADARLILLACAFGCAGSVVSLLLRLNEFESQKGKSRTFLALTGATLPIVGGVFAAVISSLYASKLISVGIKDDVANSASLYIVIGFLSGFSERFTRGLLSSAENSFVRSRRTDSDSARSKAVRQRVHGINL
jgi:hypothetical protein